MTPWNHERNFCGFSPETSDQDIWKKKREPGDLTAKGLFFMKTKTSSAKSRIVEFKNSLQTTCEKRLSLGKISSSKHWCVPNSD